MPFVSSLHLYPVKSCKTVDVTSFCFDRLGPIGDRRWMIVSDDPSRTFITQRTHPILAKLQARPLGPTSIELKFPGFESIEVSHSDLSSSTEPVVIWNDRVAARDTSSLASEWLSTILEQSVRLVGIGSDYTRFIGGEKKNEAGFADGYPLLILSKASLTDLNTRLDFPVEMSRFRPNIVVEDCGPYQEDRWSRIRIGDTILLASGPCSRCVMTTVDPDSGLRKGNEPLATLARYRKTLDGVVFGQNYTNETKRGEIAVGMEIEIL